MMNYHTHSYYCDGKYEPEAYILTALEKGMRAIGFSGHAPLPFDNEWCMRTDQVERYVHDICFLKLKYDGQIQVYCGMEVDFIPKKINTAIHNTLLDYTIGSIHFIDAFEDGRLWEIDGTHQTFTDGLNQIFDGDIQKVIERYFTLTRNMLSESKPDVLGHLDKIKIQNPNAKFYQESANFYRQEISNTLEEILASQVIVEINTRGVCKKSHVGFYPSNWVLERMYDMKIPITLSSDAHHPHELAEGFAEMYEMLYAIGFRELHTLWDGAWQPLPFTPHGVLIPEYA